MILVLGQREASLLRRGVSFFVAFAFLLESIGDSGFSLGQFLMPEYPANSGLVENWVYYAATFIPILTCIGAAIAMSILLARAAQFGVEDRWHAALFLLASFGLLVGVFNGASNGVAYPTGSHDPRVVFFDATGGLWFALRGWLRLFFPIFIVGAILAYEPNQPSLTQGQQTVAGVIVLAAPVAYLATASVAGYSDAFGVTLLALIVSLAVLVAISRWPTRKRLVLSGGLVVAALGIGAQFMKNQPENLGAAVMAVGVAMLAPIFSTYLTKSTVELFERHARNERGESLAYEERLAAHEKLVRLAWKDGEPTRSAKELVDASASLNGIRYADAQRLHREAQEAHAERQRTS
jgi:hypothetical protein